MSAAITQNIFDTAPGMTLIVAGTGLTPGASASAVLQGQGPAGTATTTLASTFASDGSSVTVTIPDGVRSGTLLVTANDLTTATTAVVVNSQYVMSSQYIGEGVDTSVLAAGELDTILRRASAYADAYIAQGNRETQTMRYLQTSEQAKWRESRRIYPRRWPIVSIDAATYIASPALTISLDPTNFVVQPDYGYAELVIWSFGWTYISQIASVTLADAGIMQYTYTAGYKFGLYPQALQEAVKMIATELLAQRNIQAGGLGGLDRIRQGYVQYDRRSEPFTIPAPAMTLLNSLVPVRAS